jgi:hypothetical protein
VVSLIRSQRIGSPCPDLRTMTPPIIMDMSSKQLGFPKPQTQSARRRVKRKGRNDLIAAVRSAVMNRDCHCRVCHERGSLHMHEVVFRSKGLPLDQTFNLMNCLALCAECHQKVHARKIWLSFEDESLGCNGEIIVTSSRHSYG